MEICNRFGLELNKNIVKGVLDKHYKPEIGVNILYVIFCGTLGIFLADLPAAYFGVSLAKLVPTRYIKFISVIIFIILFFMILISDNHSSLSLNK